MPLSWDFTSHQIEILNHHTAQQPFLLILCILSMAATILSRKADSFLDFPNIFLMLQTSTWFSLLSLVLWLSLRFLTGIIFMTHRRTGVCLKVSTLRRQFHSLSCIGLSSPCMLSCIAILSEAQNRRSLLWFHPFLLQVRICYTFDHPISLADIFLHFPVMHSSTSTLSFLLLSASYTMQGNLLSISQNGL